MNAATIIRNGVVGAVSGLAASLVMDGFQAGWSAVQEKLEPQDDGDGGDSESTTVKAADRIAEATAGQPVPQEEKEAAGQAVHYGFGALLGAFYGAASTVFPAIRTGFGVPFGAATWVAADEALVPATGLAKPPSETPASEQAYALASHLVFGAALEGSVRLLHTGVTAITEEAERRTR